MTGSWASKHAHRGPAASGAAALQDLSRAAEGAAARGGRTATLFAHVSTVALGASAVITAAIGLQQLWHKLQRSPHNRDAHQDDSGHRHHTHAHHAHHRHTHDQHGRG